MIAGYDISLSSVLSSYIVEGVGDGAVIGVYISEIFPLASGEFKV